MIDEFSYAFIVEWRMEWIFDKERHPPKGARHKCFDT